MKILSLPAIPLDAHKYTRGALLVLGGSRRFPGAAILAAQAGLLAGAGYVTLAIPASVASVAQAQMLSVPVIAARESAARESAGGQVPENAGKEVPQSTSKEVLQSTGVFAPDALPEILNQLSRIDAVVLGPGITTAPAVAEFVRSVQEWAHKTKTLLLIDADALSFVIPDEGTQTLAPHRILTPHAGELTRLFAATKTTTIEALAHHLNSIVVAKGPVTTITDGLRSVSYDEGTPALAKAGTGDVLSGIIGSLLAQGMNPFEAAEAGVIIHARTGRLAEKNYGTRSVIAEHLLEVLPFVLRDTCA